ncbi:aldo/keto reductase, partial [bacterium]|nr:aldo/keto reductase [bacterium]
WGTSEWSAEQIRQACMFAGSNGLIPPTMEQPQYNLLTRDRVEAEYRALYGDYGLGTTIWSPLASGILTGKYNDGIPDGSRLGHEKYTWLQRILEGEKGQWKLDVARGLGEIAGEMGCTTAQLAIAWCLKNPQVSTVITGASRPEQVSENMKALDVYRQLDDGLMARIDEMAGNRPAEEADWRGM